MIKLLNSILVENFRGFRNKQTLDLADPNHITFLIGQNNSGKSLIGKIFSIFDKELRPGDESHKSFSDKDFSDFEIDKRIQIQFDLNKEYFKNSDKPEFLNSSTHFDKIKLCFEVIKHQSIKCFIYLNDGENNSHTISQPDLYGNIKFEFNSIFLSKYSALNKESIERIIYELFRFTSGSFLIFAPIRSFDRESPLLYFKTGQELIKWISEDIDQSSIRKAKLEVRKYMKQLNLDDPSGLSADLKNKQLIFEFDNGNRLTSDDVGTGYTMIYILLMEIIRSNKKVIIIDEIESHLQPGLIKEMIKIIRSIGEMQLIVSTHSTSALEVAKENDYLYRFQKTKGECIFEKFYKDSAKILREVCNELGVVPGDALLSNCVIWVEGPSEILWIRAWIRSYYPTYKKLKKIETNLIEGLHFSILMTGGSLISHLSYEEAIYPIDELEEEHALKVLKVNPNPFVIIDSDASSTTSQKYIRSKNIAFEINQQNKINNRKHFDAIDDNNFHQIPNFWMLKAKELENYCHPELLKSFYSSLDSNSSSTVCDHASVTDWDVYSSDKGVGSLLEERGMKNVSTKSGTIKHKAGLASFIFQNLEERHFIVDATNITEKPNPKLISELREKLTNLFDYVLEVNGLA